MIQAFTVLLTPSFFLTLKKTVRGSQKVGLQAILHSKCLTSSKNTNLTCPEKMKDLPKFATLAAPL